MSGAKLPLKAGNQNIETSSVTLASRTYAALRREIITGNYVPGRKLHIQTLCRQFGVGLSPMREALTRLSRDGLVLHEDQRGFRVRPVDQARLDELTKTRCWLNAVGLRESIANGDDSWEEEVLIAYHRMSKLQPFISDGGRTVINRDWDIEHRRFHTSLISACGSHWLIAFCEQLFDAADFYRHVARPSKGRLKSRTSEHEQILKAALARDTGTAVQLLIDHFTRSAKLIGEELRPEEDASASRR